MIEHVPWILKFVEKVMSYFKTREEIKWVELKYPEKTGLEEKIKDGGYSLIWSNESKVPSLVEADGYEIVKVKEGKILYTLKIKTNPENLVCLKKKN